MIDILVIDKDVNYIKNFINNLSNYNKNIRISICLTTIVEIEKNIERYNFDIIILDVNLIKDFGKYLGKYKDLLILNIKKRNSKEYDNLMLPYIYKHDKISEISAKIMSVLKSKLNNCFIMETIKEEVKYLGYNPKYYGTEYLIEAIYIFYVNGIEGNDNLRKIVYPIIAQKHNKTIQNIKCNIINSTNIMVYECEEKKLLDYLGFFDYYKPGPKKIIEAILKKIEINNTKKIAN